MKPWSKRQFRVVGFAAVACVAALLAVACGGSESSDSEEPQAAETSESQADTGATEADTEAAATGSQVEAGDVVIGYSNPAASEPGLRAVGYGMTQAVEELGLGWEVAEADAGFSAEQQVSDIDSFISRNVNGITSWTLDSGAAEGVYQRASEAGIPVIGVNSPSEFFTTIIENATDSTCEVSEEQAAYIAERIPNARVLAVLGPSFVPSIDFTNKCFLDAAEAAGLTVVDSRSNTGEGDQTLEAQNLMQDMLTKNPDFDAAWAYADTSALGVSAAISAQGGEIWSGDESEGVILIARDANKAAIDAIKAGRMTATWDPHYEQSGAAAIQILAQHIADGQPLSSLPATVTIPATVWDIENADEYVDQLTRKVVLPLDTE